MISHAGRTFLVPGWMVTATTSTSPARQRGIWCLGGQEFGSGDPLVVSPRTGVEAVSARKITGPLEENPPTQSNESPDIG